MSRSRRGRSASEGELRRLAEPLAALAAGVRARRGRIALLLLSLYTVSGVTVIGASEVGVIYRAGRIVRAADGVAVHRPGLLFALPPPLDALRRVPVDRVESLRVNALHVAEPGPDEGAGSDSLDPEHVGYVLTGDRNVMHTRLVVRYKVSDAVAFLVGARRPRAVLHGAILSASVRTIGAGQLDALVGAGRGAFIRAIEIEAQRRIDEVGIGLQIVSVELEDFSPPAQVAPAFEAVQSAFIASRTASETATREATRQRAEAHAAARETVARAEAYAAQTAGLARSEAGAFGELLASYRASPAVVRQRLHADALEDALDRSAVHALPPPSSNAYRDLRLTLAGTFAHVSRAGQDAEASE